MVIQLCENVLQMKIETLRKQWGIEDEISKLIISLYDETANSSKMEDKQIVIRQIKRCLFRQIKTGLSEHLTMG